MNALELLEQLNALDESETIEAKLASQIGSSIMETVCAFANEPNLGGGWLLLGVQRDPQALFPVYEVIGINDPDKLISDLVTQARSTFNTPIRVEATAQKIGDKTVIVAFVPEVSASEKPVYFKNKKLPEGAYRRMGPTDQKCNEDDLSVFYTERQNESYDSMVIAEATFEDIDPDVLEDYRKMRAESNLDAEELRWSDEDLLIALGCAKKEKESLKITVAGVILFGKSMALRRFFPMMRVDYIRVPGKEWISDPENRFESIDMRDSIFRIVRRASALILEDLPKAFQLPEESLQREEKPLIPTRVIREALVNALMHRSYRVHAPIQIIRYTNRLEIRNPGYSLKSAEHLGEPGSLTRNPKIAAVLHETRFAETKGSGIRVMREMMERTGLSLPVFESDRAHDTFTARYLFHHFLSPDDLAWLSLLKEYELSDDEAKALIFVRETGAIDNATYRDLCRVDTLGASARLRHLRDVGLLETKGSGPKTYYIPSEKLTNIANANGLIDMSNPLSDKIEGLSQESQALSQELPPEISDLITGLGKRAKPEMTTNAILKLCEYKSLKASEIAKILGRDQDYITRDYLTPMVDAGTLTYTIPAMPNHPDQAYVTPKKDEA
jgi:ATP-dependent DNA helicase RecG